ncbi:MAG TPA: phosphoenolpyruvate--protein phosphotransferase [Vicinamibacterales bacterium]|jgi:phosphotransferase system enzyme I (PtsI)|nr:phosphoenolpyruvate--protein phosphotransferase [Vicinamibacterales bacterium]
MRRLTGIGVSPGVVAGRAVILIQRAQVLRYQIAAARIDHELQRLEASRARSREQLVEIRARVARRRRELASLFDAQLLMLDDPMLVPRAAGIVREQRVNAEWAVQQVFREFSAVFDEVADPYLRERKGDVADLIGRLRMNLRQGVLTPRDLLRELDEASVLVADELTPSLAAQVDWSRVRGFATDAGSRTYHTAILARSLEVPAVVGLHNASAQVQAGDLVVIDGSASQIILDPTPEVIERAARHADDRRPASTGDSDRRRPAATADGLRIRIEANVEFPDDLAAARYAGAEGIGLYRTEFQLASGARDIENEEHQYQIYRGMLEGMAPGPVTVRTFDVDEDQLASKLTRRPLDGGWTPDEERGSRQGLRGLRLSLTRPEVFRVQLRALLRAARHGELRIMFPFVSSVEQLREARAMVVAAAADLERLGEAVPRVPIGVMIEIPAAAYTADLLAREVDFFTIGTNDLIQYCLAVDRADERVSRLYEPLHPAILRMIVMVRRAARRRRIPVSLCGEMASDPALLTLLVGLGLTEFSMTPGAIPVAKQVLRDVRSDDLHAMARRIMRLATIDEIERELLTAVGNSGRLGRMTGGVPS